MYLGQFNPVIGLYSVCLLEWFHGQNVTSRKVGIFPQCFTSLWPNCHDSILSEVSLTLQEWKPRWQKLYENKDMAPFLKVYNLIERLIFLRRQMQIGVLTQEQVMSLEIRMADCVDAGNALLGLEMIPREANGRICKENAIGMVHLFNRVIAISKLKAFFCTSYFGALTKSPYDKTPSAKITSTTIALVDNDLFYIN